MESTVCAASCFELLRTVVLVVVQGRTVLHMVAAAAAAAAAAAGTAATAVIAAIVAVSAVGAAWFYLVKDQEIEMPHVVADALRPQVPPPVVQHPSSS
jgi:hypothetical protein